MPGIHGTRSVRPFGVLLVLAMLATTVGAEEKQQQRKMEPLQADLHTCRLLAQVAYRIGKGKYDLPENCNLYSLQTSNGRIEASIDRLTPAEGTVTQASEFQEVSFHSKFTWPEIPVAKTDLSIPIVLTLSCEEVRSGHLWTEFGRNRIGISQKQPAVAELDLKHNGSLKSGEYTITAMVFAELSAANPLSLLAIRQTHLIIAESGEVHSRPISARDRDLQTCQLLSRIAYQIGSDKFHLPPNDLMQARLSVYNQLKYTLELLPVPGTTARGSEILSGDCTASFDWIDFPLVQADLRLSGFLSVSWENADRVHLWSDLSKPEVGISWNQPGPSVLQMTQELNSLRTGKLLPPGNYRGTALLYVKLPPQGIYTLVGIKQTRFTLETDQKEPKLENREETVRE